MVVSINNNIVNENKPKGNNNVIVHYSTNLTTSTNSPMVNPNSTNIQSGKTLNPTQTISVIGKGTDPEVIANHPTKINPYTKEKLNETQTLAKTQTTTQTTNLTPQDVLGSFAKAFNGKGINQILQITNGLTLPEIFNILSQYGININNWKNANLTINGNKIIIEHISYNFIGIMTYESKNILEIENKDGLIIVKHEKYQIDRWVDSSGPHKETNLISDSYYFIDPKTKELLYKGSGSFKSVLPELSLIKVLGPIMNRYLSYNPNYFAQKVLQITGGLTLPELFQILGQSESFWTPTYSYSSWSGGTSGFDRYVANVSIQGNKIVFTTNTQVSNSWSGGSTNDTTIDTLTIEPYNTTYKGKTYHFILVKEKQYVNGQTSSSNSPTDVYQDTITWYYIIDPKTKQVIYKGQEQPQQTQYWLPSQQSESGDVAQPSQVISNILQQYGYQLTQQELQEIDNLQKGQSITVDASAGSAGALFEITYLGNNQYQIQSVDRFYNLYDFNNPWTSINETVTVPTYSYNNGQISTTNLSVSGQVTTYGTTNISEPYYNATYNVNETIPINYEYNTQTGQLTFWFSNSQGGATLQSISLPTITTQQLQALESGQNIGLKPGWYYNPQTGQIIQVSYQTVQQPSTSSSSQYLSLIHI